ncbi:MAG: rhodanese-like domain-containing protein [Betaproteobacteria bacterium]|nr:rhodanese-like domain-containing protein [Betaproteobacteria bacterium]
MSFFEFVQNPFNALLIAIALISGFMLVWPGFRSAGKRVNPNQAIQLINHENAIIIDVREAGEFMASHLPEAKNIPLKDLDSRMSELEPLKEKNLLFVCASGVRAGQASFRLEKQGFAHISCLDGGVDAWKRAGLPLIKSPKK